MIEAFRRLVRKYVSNAPQERFSLASTETNKNIPIRLEIDYYLDQIFSEPLVTSYSYKYDEDSDWKNDFPNMLFFNPELSSKKLIDIAVDKEKSFSSGNFRYMVSLGFAREQEFEGGLGTFSFYDSSVYVFYDSRSTQIHSTLDLGGRVIKKKDEGNEREIFRLELTKEIVFQILKLKAGSKDGIE